MSVVADAVVWEPPRIGSWGMASLRRSLTMAEVVSSWDDMGMVI